MLLQQYEASSWCIVEYAKIIFYIKCMVLSYVKNFKITLINTAYKKSK
jgi:hypothetical protein